MTTRKIELLCVPVQNKEAIGGDATSNPLPIVENAKNRLVLPLNPKLVSKIKEFYRKLPEASFANGIWKFSSCSDSNQLESSRISGEGAVLLAKLCNDQYFIKEVRFKGAEAINDYLEKQHAGLMNYLLKDKRGRTAGVHHEQHAVTQDIVVSHSRAVVVIVIVAAGNTQRRNGLA